MPMGNHMVTVGADFIEEELKDKTTNRISNRTKVDTSKYALFAEDEWMVTDTFSVTAGADG